MKKRKNKSLKSFGITWKVNKELNKYEGKVLFPEQLKKANEQLKGVKIPKV